MMEMLEELHAIQKEEERRRNSSVIYRVLTDLIRMEKEALYGVRISNKSVRVEKIFDEGFSRYKEEKGSAPTKN